MDGDVGSSAAADLFTLDYRVLMFLETSGLIESPNGAVRSSRFEYSPFLLPSRVYHQKDGKDETDGIFTPPEKARFDSHVAGIPNII